MMLMFIIVWQIKIKMAFIQIYSNWQLWITVLMPFDLHILSWHDDYNNNKDYDDYDDDDNVPKDIVDDYDDKVPSWGWNCTSFTITQKKLLYLCHLIYWV